MNAPIAQALLSVSDKTGLVEFARALDAMGVKLISTGGTAKAIADAGLPVTEVADYTGFPEMLDGRVKTLHPAIHGGILARRDSLDHMAALAEHGIASIDLVVVNLYPFRQAVARPGCSLDEAIENIDIGGPTLVRAAAKNHAHVGVVVDPADYPALLDELRANGRQLGNATRFRLAQKAFSHTASYDGAISNYLTARDETSASQAFPGRFNWQGVKVQDLRYGENPHQQAAFYRDESPAPGTIATYRQLQGKELSYNNIADSDAAWECVNTFAEPACVIVKHANPCGAAIAATPLEAYTLALATDPTSAFGGIIAFNREIDAETVDVVAAQFLEVLIAPGYSVDAIERISKKINVRVLAVQGGGTDAGNIWDMKRVGGGMLLQTADRQGVDAASLSRGFAQGADAVAARRPAVRLAGRQVRQVERHRLWRGRKNARHRCRADESRRFDTHRRDQGAGCRPVARRIGRCVGCVLSVSRRSRCRRRQRSGRDYPARRQRARCRSHRSGR